MKIIPIEGVIGWDVTEQSMRESLAAANGDDVEFHFSSPGGLIGAGLGIGSQIRNYPGKTTAVLTGYAMSMSSYLPQCCDERVAFDDAVFMIHNARGMTWGDHNDVLKYGEYLKGLSGVIAKKLAKCSGNELDQVVDWMDGETFFFGDEIMAAGFVDEMRKSQKEIDKETAMATARAGYDGAVAKMSSDVTMVKDDLNRAMAMNLSDIPIAAQSPAGAGNKTKEVQQMTLKDLLAANPATKAEFDAALVTASAEGNAAGTAAMQSTINKVSPFLASTDYPAIIRTTALKVLTGEENASTLISAVAAVDAVREDQKASAAASAAAGTQETPGQQPDAPADGMAVVTDDAGLDAAIASAKQGGN